MQLIHEELRQFICKCDWTKFGIFFTCQKKKRKLHSHFKDRRSNTAAFFDGPTLSAIKTDAGCLVLVYLCRYLPRTTFRLGSANRDTWFPSIMREPPTSTIERRKETSSSAGIKITFECLRILKLRTNIRTEDLNT